MIWPISSIGSLMGEREASRGKVDVAKAGWSRGEPVEPIGNTMVFITFPTAWVGVHVA
jgi:hypothetical protein